MNCTEFNDCLNDSIDGELGAAEQMAFDTHRASCEACRALYTSELAMLEGLRAMPVIQPPAGFADRVLANAIKRNVPQRQNYHRRGFMTGFGSAVAAALAVWVVVGMLPGELPDTDSAPGQDIASSAPVGVEAQPPVLSVALALNTQQTVRLAFASSEPLAGAKITIHLPENVALVGYPGRRELSWKTNLEKGDNLLSLPIIATQVAQGQLIADIEYEGRVRTLTLNLETGAGAAPATSSTDSKFHPLVG